MNRRDASRWPARPAPGWAWRILVAACTLGGTLAAAAHPAPAATRLDSRVRVLAYAPDEIYRLQGYVGWHIDLEFESGETFVGLGAGDIEALSFTAQDNHLFLKPKAPDVMTNLTVLTNRRHYRFEYAAALLPSDPQAQDLVYSVRFVYPSALGQVPGERAAAEVKARLAGGAASRPRNLDYWYRGDAVIKPVAVSDDGVHTRLRFAPHAEQPAIFAINDDGSESLVNFSMADGEVIVHRVARRLALRRGRLQGCIVNAGFTGPGERLPLGTVAPGVERAVRGERP